MIIFPNPAIREAPIHYWLPAAISLTLLLFSLMYHLVGWNTEILMTGLILSFIATSFVMLIPFVVERLILRLFSEFLIMNKYSRQFAVALVLLYALAFASAPLFLVVEYSTDFARFVMLTGDYDGVTFAKKVELIFYFNAILVIFIFQFFVGLSDSNTINETNAIAQHVILSNVFAIFCFVITGADIYRVILVILLLFVIFSFNFIKVSCEQSSS